MSSGSEVGSYLRLIVLCFTRLQAGESSRRSKSEAGSDVVFDPQCTNVPPHCCPISTRRVSLINAQAQRKLLQTWIILVVVKQHIVQIGPIDGPTEKLSQILAAIGFQACELDYPHSQHTAPHSQHTASHSQHTAPHSQHTASHSRHTAPHSQHTAPHSRHTAPHSPFMVSRGAPTPRPETPTPKQV